MIKIQTQRPDICWDWNISVMNLESLPVEYQETVEQEVMLTVQDMPIRSARNSKGRTGLVFFDTGSNISLLQTAFVEKINLEGKEKELWTQVSEHRHES